jgi:hypothetical protein
MRLDGNDASYCSNGATERKIREETAEERATYRKWMRGMVVFYCVLLSIGCVVAAFSYSSVGLKQLTNLSSGRVTALFRAK